METPRCVAVLFVYAWHVLDVFVSDVDKMVLVVGSTLLPLQKPRA